MVKTLRRVVITLLLIGTIAVDSGPVEAQAAAIDVYELADYRLTAEVFERFVQASGRIAAITREDPSFTYAPLFTKELALSGDAVAEAASLVTRLQNHTALAAALETATLTPREYAKFAITLIVAHLAHGFLASGVLPRVPSGAPTINVEFVKTHEADVTATLATLGIRD
jgi:hypothetical protein